MAHDANDATYVRQSLDYAQFGRVTATLGAGGLADSTGVVTAFAHHGSLLDAATGLQQKGQRWYSPDLGRFVSEDPIQDGSNWYAFAGNDPVNYADPASISRPGRARLPLKFFLCVPLAPLRLCERLVFNRPAAKEPNAY